MNPYKIKISETPLQLSAVDKTVKQVLRFLPAVIFMVLIFSFSSLPGSEVARTTRPIIHRIPKTIQLNPGTKPIKIEWLKVGHWVGYSGLGLAYLFAFRPGVQKPVFAAVLASFLYAVTDELHQVFVPGRHAWVSDIALDTFAAVSSILTADLFRFVQKSLDIK